MLWESVTDVADVAAIRRWKPEPRHPAGVGTPGRRSPSAAPAIRRPVRNVAVQAPAAVLTELRRWLQASMVAPAFHASVRLDVGGLEEVSRLAEPTILVANHASHLDTPAVLAALPPAQRARTAVAVPGRSPIASGWRAAVAAALFNAVRQPGIPNRKRLTGAPARRHLLLFSEGPPSADGLPGAFGVDAARLAIESQRPVMPVGIRGSYAAMPRGQSWPSSGRPRVAVRFGPSLHPAAGETAEDLTARTRTEVDRLIVEDITSWWEAQTDPRVGAEPESPAGSWRRRWQQTRSAEPGKTPARRKIWRR